jgi:hypothetical protein
MDDPIMNDADRTVKETKTDRSHQPLIRWLTGLMIATLIAPILFWLALLVQMIASH